MKDLENYSEKDLLNMRNLGPTSVEEIKKYISTFGISLKIEIKEEPIKIEKMKEKDRPFFVKYQSFENPDEDSAYILFSFDEILCLLDDLNSIDPDQTSILTDGIIGRLNLVVKEWNDEKNQM